MRDGGYQLIHNNMSFSKGALLHGDPAKFLIDEHAIVGSHHIIWLGVYYINVNAYMILLITFSNTVDPVIFKRF